MKKHPKIVEAEMQIIEDCDLLLDVEEDIDYGLPEDDGEFDEGVVA